MDKNFRSLVTQTEGGRPGNEATVFLFRERMGASHPDWLETGELSLCTAETCRDQSDPRS